MKKILKVIIATTLSTMVLVGCGAKSQESTNMLNKVKDSGTMKVGLMGTYPPYSFMNEENEIDGFDADIAKEVAKRIGVKVEFITNEWSGMVAGLEKGKFDAVVSQMTITPERKETMDFSKPYIKNVVSAIVKEDNNTIKGIEDFKGKKIGVGLGTNDEAYLRNEVIPKVGEFEIVTYNDVTTTILDLNTGRIDATVNNIFAIKPIVDKNNFKIKAVGNPIKEDFAAIAINKGNTEFLQEIDKALEQMKDDGTYSEIFVKWFGVEPEL